MRKRMKDKQRRIGWYWVWWETNHWFLMTVVESEESSSIGVLRE